MTTTAIIILVLIYGVLGAICLMVGLVIGAAARRPQERELHEMDNEQTAVPTRWMKERGF